MRTNQTKTSFKTALAVLFLLFTFPFLRAQSGGNEGQISGNFQFDGQYYYEDTIIGTPAFPQEFGSNSFLYLTYTKGKFKAGARFEAYLPPLQGFTRTQGAGLSHRFAQYSHEKMDVTVGTFYEQFGSGMTLRAYEEWGLGFDNAIDGARVKLKPIAGLTVTGLIGNQRNAIDATLVNKSAGIIRGADIDLSLNDVIPGMDTMRTRVSLGWSFVSRFQADNDPILNLPENVGTHGARININSGKFNFGAEYAYKINDPGSVNAEIYKPGNGLLVQGSYSTRGLGISLTAKRIDNLDFRSDRAATFNNLNINYLPPQTRQHTYRLATLFPYATQPLGEFGIQAEVLYNIKRDSKLGGKYGTNITFNFSRLHGLDKNPTADPTEGYTTEFFGLTDKPFFQDINIEITRKFSKKVKGTAQYLYVIYDKALFSQLTGFKTTEEVHAHVAIVDVSYKISRKHTLRAELQHCATQQELGSWAMLLAEYTFAPHWFIAVFDEYNYGNAEVDQRLHYYSGQLGYNWGQYQIRGGYGRQRAGVLCVGGICRVVPASNGFTLSVSGSF